ncbi:unnamed protein product [Closterium sp. NIES-65]|nr:unnamed protein product [Closterium sp. NIES-65]
MRSIFKRYKLVEIAMGEEKMPGEGDARDRWIEKSAVLYDLILQSVNNDMFQHIKDLVELDDSGPKLKDTYAMMAAAGSEVSQMEQCTNIISVLDNSLDNLIPTLNVQQEKWTPQWLRRQILQEDFRRSHTGGGAANKTAEGYGAAGGSRGRGGGRGRANGGLMGLGNVLLVEGLSANLLSVRRLRKSKAKGLEVKGAAKEIGSCPICLETKFTKFPFSSSTGPAKAPLALVHMDVVGPTRALSLSGSRYFLTIVDDHTGAVWVYPLKTKGEVATAVLKEWMPSSQRESGHKVKVICTDNGGEFIGADLEAVLKKKGSSISSQCPTTLSRTAWLSGSTGPCRKVLALSLGVQGCRIRFGQVQVTVSEEEISGVIEDGGEPEVEEQQQQQPQQQQGAPQGAARPADRPRRDVLPS